MLEGFVGHVGLGVVGRFAVLADVDTEHGEVTSVAGPHPVVGVAAELADVAGGSAHKADIGEDFVDVHKILVAVVEGFDDGFVVGAGNCLIGEDGDVLLDDAFAFHLGGLFVDAFKNAGSYIFHTDETGGGKAFAGYFLVAFHSPESVG